MKAFARWRVRVWDRRLAQYRQEWDQAAKADPGGITLDGVDLDMFWERLVTQAMAKRTKWCKRTGCSLHRGACG